MPDKTPVMETVVRHAVEAIQKQVARETATAPGRLVILQRAFDHFQTKSRPAGILFYMKTHEHLPSGAERYTKDYPRYDCCECGAVRHRFTPGDPWHICKSCVYPGWESVVFPENQQNSLT
jgi:hypothetical protein